MGSRFSDDYFDSYDDFHDAVGDLVSAYMPEHGHLPLDENGDYADPETQDQYEWAIALLEAHEFDSFFAWLDMDYEDISDFWEDYRDMYDSV